MEGKDTGETTEAGGWQRGSAQAAAALLVLLVFYLLAPGPISYFVIVTHTGNSYLVDVLNVVFYPIEWLYRNVHWYTVYIDWWHALAGHP